MSNPSKRVNLHDWMRACCREQTRSEYAQGCRDAISKMARIGSEKNLVRAIDEALAFHLGWWCTHLWISGIGSVTSWSQRDKHGKHVQT